MAKSSSGLWGSALALVLLSAACGDDDGGSGTARNDGGNPSPDASGPDSGIDGSVPVEGGTLDGTVVDGATVDGSVVDGATVDAGGDAAADGDAASDGGLAQFSGACFFSPGELIARTDAGVQSDAGLDELTMALTVAGTDTSLRRAQVLFPVFCASAVICDERETMGQQYCIDGYLESYQEAMAESLDPACLDRALDAHACAAATRNCDCIEECLAFVAASDRACAVP